MRSKPILIVAGEPKSVFFEIFFKSIKHKNYNSPLIIICSKNTVDVFNNKTIQSTMGSIFRVNIHYCELKEFFVSINKKPQTYAATLDGKNLKNVKKNKKDNFIIIGSESHGISEELMKFVDEKIKIENVSAGGESLNAAIATSIILYQLS